MEYSLPNMVPVNRQHRGKPYQTKVNDQHDLSASVVKDSTVRGH